MSAEWIIKYVCYNHISSGLQRLLDHHQSFHICGSTQIMAVNLALSSILNTDTDKLSVAYRKLVGIDIRVDARGQLLDWDTLIVVFQYYFVIGCPPLVWMPGTTAPSTITPSLNWVS